MKLILINFDWFEAEHAPSNGNPANGTPT